MKYAIELLESYLRQEKLAQSLSLTKAMKQRAAARIVHLEEALKKLKK